MDQINTLYAWKTDDTWHYRMKQLGNIEAGEFNAVKHKDAVAYLNSGAKALLTENISMQLSEAYLKLTPHEQNNIKAIISYDWPILDEMSDAEKVDICRAILEAKPPRDEAHAGSVNAFRAFLFPSTINMLSQSISKAEKKPTIPDVIHFIQRYLRANLDMLGDKAALKIPPIPESANYSCGQLPEADNSSMRLIYQGLSEGGSALFQLILNYETAGIESFGLENLAALEKAMIGLQNPAEHPDYADAASDILAALQATREGSQEAQQLHLKSICKAIQNTIQVHVFHKLREMTDEARRTISPDVASTFEPLLSLIQTLIDLDVDLASFRELEITTCLALYKIGLFSGGDAELYLACLLKQDQSEELLKAIKKLNEIGLLSGDKGKYYLDIIVNQENPEKIGEAIHLFHTTNWFSKNNEALYFDTITQHADPLRAIRVIQVFDEAGLLKGDNTKHYLDEIASRRSLETLDSMIQLLKSKNLFQGDKEKLYLDKMLAHKALSDVHTAIYMLDRYGVLVEDKVELYLDVIFKSKCPFEMIHAIKMLESQHLLSGEKTKRYLDALSEHVHPLVLSGVIATFEQNASYFGDNAPACLNAILSHHNPRLMYDSIVKLNEAGLLSEADAKLYIQLVKNLSSTEDAEEGVEIESIVALLQEIKSNPDVVAKLKKSETLPSTISELHQLITREVSEHPDSSGFHAFRKEVRSLNPDSGEDADDASHNLDSPKKM